MTQDVLLPVQTLHLMATTGQPGAPTLTLSLIYNPDTEPATLDGKGMITQAVTPPGGRIEVQGIHGEVTEMRHFQSSGNQMISIRGLCSEPNAQVLYPFSAVFVTDSNWKGEGSFTYGSKTVSGVPIRQASENEIR